MTWETVIGLEIHAQLSTTRRSSAVALTRFGDQPNANTVLFALVYQARFPF